MRLVCNDCSFVMEGKPYKIESCIIKELEIIKDIHIMTFKHNMKYEM